MAGERYNPNVTIPRYTSPTSGVMVWGAIAYDSCSSVVVIRGRLTDHQKVQEILRLHVLPFLAGCLGALFQKDNAHPHRDRISRTVYVMLRQFLGQPACLICGPSGVKSDGTRAFIMSKCPAVCCTCGQICRTRTYGVCLTPCRTIPQHVSGRKAV